MPRFGSRKADRPRRARILGLIRHFAVSAVGRDRPGIVAAIAEGLLAVEGNVEDSRMTILGGHFAVMLIVSVPDASGSAIEAALAPAVDRLGLEVVTVNEVEHVEAGAPADHVLTVYGSDHPGIVHAVSSELAAAGVNITDLQTRLAGSPEAPIYMMMLELALGGTAVDDLKATLGEVAVGAAVEVELRPLAAEAL